MNYYNEFDPKAAAWLQELINAGHIPDGYVDTRSIVDVRPSDLAGFTQCHFFAGIGVWSYALGLAGWPTDRPVWTGSCPCQPFSAAGKGDGFADERHLWPHFHHLIRVCRPSVVLGEQVASKDGLAWLDLVATDLEGEGYAAGAADLCAAGVGAPHIRQRIYWVAYADNARLEGRDAGAMGLERQTAERGGRAGRLAHADSGLGRERRALIRGRAGGGDAQRGAGSGGVGVSGGLADANDPGLSRFAGLRLQRANFHDADGRSPVGGFWAGADWLPCRDNKWRPVEPGTFPLVDVAPARVGRLRGCGNAIVAQCAQAFIEAVMDVTA
jgi:DNA (cytosine-5)-methyltransferase 1